ncbi:hypothetical protein ACVGOW_24595 [Pseudonocardia saturnea]
MALGLVVAAIAPGSALAATPEEEARALLQQAVGLEGEADEQRARAALIYDAELDKAEGQDTQAALRFRDAQDKARAGLPGDARASIEQGLGIAAQADDARELGALLYDAELDKADAAHVQAELRRSLAQQRFQEAGSRAAARAAGLRLEGQISLYRSRVAADGSTFDGRLAASAGGRAQLLRQTARTIRTSSADPTLLEMASRLEQQADVDRQEAQRLNREARQLSRESAAAASRAETRFRNADRLDPGGL